MQTNQVKNLTENFFKNLGCQVNWENECIIIKNVPADFEKFFGKKSPYSFTFDTPKDNAELITKGSYLLKVMNDYLDNKGEITIFKIDINFDPKEEIPKIYPLKNCKIISANKKNYNRFFVRFTFLTNLQYMNEKEQIKTEIYVNEGEIFDFDKNKYNLIEGKKRDVSLNEQVDKDYNKAKEHLKRIVNKKVNEVGNYLNETLNKEIDRVKAHFQQQLSEIDSKLNQDKARLEELKKESVENEEKIEKLEKRINELEYSEEREKILKEQEFFIQDEVQKHSLNVKNKLVNTSIIYYPIFDISFYLKGKNSVRIMQLLHDPFKNQTSKALCDSCKSEIDEFILCAAGHLTCRNCGERCNLCKEVICNKCLVSICSECGQKACENCIIRCKVCGKRKCKSHLNKDNICSKCIRRCFTCGGEFTPEFIVHNPSNGRDICRKCRAQDVKRDVLKTLD